MRVVVVAEVVVWFGTISRQEKQVGSSDIVGREECSHTNNFFFLTTFFFLKKNFLSLVNRRYKKKKSIEP